MTDTAILTAAKPRRFQCRHIFTDGHRCGSPCLRQEDFCFYHHTSRGRRAAIPSGAPIETIDLSQGEHRASSFVLPIPEDRSAIQHAIGQILNRLAANELDPRRAGLLLYGLQIASINLAQIKPDAKPVETVEEIVTDPELGTLAPEAELDPPGKRGRSLTQMLLDDLLAARHNALADDQASAQPEPPQPQPPQPASPQPTSPQPEPPQPTSPQSGPLPSPSPELLPSLHAAAARCHLRPHKPLPRLRKDWRHALRIVSS